MVKMKRKAISLILAMLIILASFPLTAFAADGDKTVESVELTATKALIENYSGWKETDENGVVIDAQLDSSGLYYIVTVSHESVEVKTEIRAVELQGGGDGE